MLIIHGTDDQTVPFTNSLCFYDVCGWVDSMMAGSFEAPHFKI